MSEVRRQNKIEGDVTGRVTQNVCPYVSVFSINISVIICDRNGFFLEGWSMATAFSAMRLVFVSATLYKCCWILSFQSGAAINIMLTSHLMEYLIKTSITKLCSRSWEHYDIFVAPHRQRMFPCYKSKHQIYKFLDTSWFSYIIFEYNTYRLIPARLPRYTSISHQSLKFTQYLILYHIKVSLQWLISICVKPANIRHIYNMFLRQILYSILLK